MDNLLCGELFSNYFVRVANQSRLHIKPHTMNPQLQFRRPGSNYPYNIRSSRFFLIASLLLFFLSMPGQNAALNKSNQLNLIDGVALSGYDAVAYFNQGKAIKGDKQFNSIYEGVKYCFSSKQNLEAFKKEPHKYLPQYGGWCAYAMGAKGEKVEVNPETFKVVDGKLYLFYNKYFTNTLTSWNKDEKKLERQADENWKKISP
jgi:YHS domain-containing protein